MNKAILYTGILCSALSFSFAQNKPEVDSKKIIQKGVELHDSEKYQEAITEFKKVNKNDTNFVLACLELTNTYIANGQDSLAIQVCDAASILPSSYAPTILLYKANALDNMKKSDEAIKLYEEGIKKYPLNNSFYYELGVLKYRQEKYKEANDLFIQSIKCNPYHAASHHQMANLALKQGKLIPAVLAWQFYLLVDNSSERAKAIVGELEKIAKNEYEFKDVVKVDGLSDQDDFSELEALLRSKVALSDKYKSKLDVKFNITKQLQLIFEKIHPDKSDKGFYMEFYAPIFEQVNKKGYFEPFAYNILAGMGNDKVDSWMKKHKDDSEEFSKWFIAYLGDNFSTYETMLGGKMVKARHWYSDSKILAVGNQNASGNNVGYWNFYFSNGILRSEGAFNESNKREGVWKFYYPSGLIKDLENYKNGEVEGIVEGYYTNGSIETQKRYVNSLLDGLQSVYYATGGKETTYEYKAGKQEGKESSYYKDGKLKYEINMVNQKYEGPFIQYYNNGHIMEKSTFKENNRSGKYESYYNYPEKTLKSEATYEKGIAVGEFKSYYRNGKQDEIGSYKKNGNKDGLWKEFYDNGSLRSEENFSDGKWDGSSKYYDDAGRMIEEYIYKNDILQEYKAYDPTGKVVYQNKKDGKNNYDAQLYYSNANKKREGRVQGGKLTGVWKDYNMNGFITSEDNYAAGKKDGKSVTYHENGKVKAETDYSEGETNGYYREYFKNGKMRMEGAYIMDKEIDVWKTYYINGQVEAVNFYIDGKQDGWQEYYAINGKPDYDEFYELGYVKKRVFYDTTGKVAQEIVFNKGSGELETKYKNGKTKLKSTYKDNMLQGPSNAFYPDGKPLSTKTFVNDQAEGEIKFFYPDGKPEWSRMYLDGDKHGKHTQYYQEGGNVLRETNYAYGRQDGKTFFYYPNKQMEREYDYKDNDINGKATIYTETGELAIERYYKGGYILSYSYMDKNGAMVPPIEVKNETGTIKTYYKTGTPALEYSLKNGALEGKRTMYFINGKVQEDETYVANELTGTCKYYYASGKLKSEENYNADEKNGKCTSYYENGKVKSEEYFVEGKQHGTCKYYDATGKLTKTYVYYNDELIDEK
ncbi:MAG: tetratricopeptide repeat protein [Bacteroidetes bacterium]|nr:tetratricopeptide repeat protein [Bacteroidota bacterium]